MADSLTCPKCGGPREPKALYCPFCGAVFNRLESSGPSAFRASSPPPPRPSAYAGTPAYAGVAPDMPADGADLNPYQPPSAPVSPPYGARPVTVSEAAIPETVLKKIKNGWVAAVISGSLTLVFIAIAANFDLGIPLDTWALVDVALIFGLAYGISRKSRACATAMFLYFLGSKIYFWTETKSVSGIWLALVFIYYFYQAMLGTFEYHRLKTS